MTAEEYQTEAERITPQLRQTALRYMGDASLSEDIAQDVLLRLWQLLDELRKANLYDTTSQAFAVFLPVRSEIGRAHV